jgi:AcrR family transcriptional regulator
MTREETQARILEAAFRSLADEGYRDTTMKEIAGRAGLATGLAHYYFESKEDLLLAALEHGCPEATIEFQGVAPLDQARLGFAAEKEWQVWGRDAYKVIFDMVGLGMHDPKVAAKIRGFLNNRRQVVTQVAEAVLSEAPNPQGLTAAGVSAAVWGGFLGIALQRLIDPEFDGDAALKALEVMALTSATARGEGG